MMLDDSKSPCAMDASVELKKQVYQTSVTSGGCDSWFLMRNGKVCRVVSMDDTNNTISVIAIPRRHYKNFFVDPIASMGVGVYKIKIKKLGGSKKNVPIEQLKRKMSCLVSKDSVILVAFNHDCVWRLNQPNK